MLPIVALLAGGAAFAAGFGGVPPRAAPARLERAGVAAPGGGGTATTPRCGASALALPLGGAAMAVAAAVRSSVRRGRAFLAVRAVEDEEEGNFFFDPAGAGRRERLLEKRIGTTQQMLALEREVSLRKEQQMLATKRHLEGELKEQSSVTKALQMQVHALQFSYDTLKELADKTGVKVGAFKENNLLALKLQQMEDKLARVQAEAIAKAIEAVKAEGRMAVLKTVGATGKPAVKEVPSAEPVIDVSVKEDAARKAIEAALLEVQAQKAISDAAAAAKDSESASLEQARSREWIPHVFVDFSGGIARW